MPFSRPGAPSALGFGVAYYFDTEHGGTRRKQLKRWRQRTARTFDSVLTPEVGDAPPVFSPLWRRLQALEADPSGSEPVEAAR